MSLPELEARVAPSRAGPPTLQLGGRHVHSPYDPEREGAEGARALRAEAAAAGASGIALVGAGLGHLAERLGSRALVWEPFRGVFQEMGPNLRVVHEPAEFAAALRDHGPRTHLAVHPGYAELTGFEQRYALRALRRLRGSAPHEPAIASRRALAALARLPRLAPLAALGPCLRGKTAIVASGGPSLDAALPALSAARDAAVVLAAPQALRRLLAAGLRPDFVVHPDPADLLGRELGPEGAPFGALLADTSAHPAVLDRAPEKTFLFHLRTPQLVERAWRRARLDVIDEPFVTVTETAVWLARALGARRVLLAGGDFASDATGYGAPFRARGVRDDFVPTNPVYFHGARHLAALLAADEGFEVARTGTGVAVPGARALGPHELGAWLARGEGGRVHLPRSGHVPLAEAVRSVLSEAPPPAGPGALLPKSEPWLDFAPLEGKALEGAWGRTRRALGVT